MEGVEVSPANQMMMTKTLHIGLVGCGNWGKFILRDLKSLGCHVSVVVSSPESIKNAKQFGADVFIPRMDEMKNVDGIVVAVPSSFHSEIIDQLLDRPSTPIFTEKPMTCNTEDARRLVKKGGERIFVMDKWRYHPGIELLREIANKQELGDVLGMRLIQVGWGDPHPDVDVVWTLTSHCLSIALEVLGEIPKPIAAFGEYLNDHAVGIVGALGHNPWVVLEVSARSPEKRREFRLHCSRGVAFVPEGITDHVRVVHGTDPFESKTPVVEKWPVSTEMPLLRELKTFVEYLHGGPAPKSTAFEGLSIVEAIDQLRRLGGIRSLSEQTVSSQNYRVG